MGMLKKDFLSDQSLKDFKENKTSYKLDKIFGYVSKTDLCLVLGIKSRPTLYKKIKSNKWNNLEIKAIDHIYKIITECPLSIQKVKLTKDEIQIICENKVALDYINMNVKFK